MHIIPKRVGNEIFNYFIWIRNLELSFFCFLLNCVLNITTIFCCQFLSNYTKFVVIKLGLFLLPLILYIFIAQYKYQVYIDGKYYKYDLSWILLHAKTDLEFICCRFFCNMKLYKGKITFGFVSNFQYYFICRYS